MNYEQHRHNKGVMSKKESRRRHFQAQIGEDSTARKEKQALIDRHTPTETPRQAAIRQALEGLPKSKVWEIQRAFAERDRA